MTQSRAERIHASNSARKRRHAHKEIQETRIQRLFNKLKRLRNRLKKKPH